MNSFMPVDQKTRCSLFHMPAFIAISGYLAGSKISAGLSLAAFMRARILPVLVPLLVWSVSIGLMKIAKSHSFNPIVGAMIIFNAIESIYWFLWSLLLGASAAWFANRFGNFWRSITISIALLLFLIPLDLAGNETVPLVRFTVPFYLAAYLHSRSGATFRSIGILTAVGLLCVAAVCWCCWNEDTYIYKNRLTYWRTETLPTIAVMYVGTTAATIAFLRLAIALYDRIRDWMPVSLLIALGGITLEIYLVQTLYFYLPNPITKQLLQLLPGYITCLVEASIVIGLTIVLARLTRRFTILEIALWGRIPKAKIEILSLSQSGASNAD